MKPSSDRKRNSLSLTTCVFDQTESCGYYYVDSIEGRWNSGRVEEGGNLGYKPRYKEGYFPVSPTDTMQDLRTEMLLTMAECGVPIEKHHHEVATAGTSGTRIPIRFFGTGGGLLDDL